MTNVGALLKRARAGIPLHGIDPQEQGPMGFAEIAVKPMTAKGNPCGKYTQKSAQRIFARFVPFVPSW
jgi:hypothetical protein